MQKTIPRNYCEMQDVNTYIDFMLSILSRTKWNDNNTSYWHTQLAFSVVSDCQALVVHFAARHIPFKPLLCFCHPPVNCLLYPVHSVCGPDVENVSCTTVASLLWPSLTEFVNGRFLPNRSRSSHRHGYGLQPRLSHPSAAQTWFSHSLKV